MNDRNIAIAAIHSINSELDAIEEWSKRLTIADQDYLAATFQRMGLLMAKLLDRKREPLPNYDTLEEKRMDLCGNR